MLKCGVEKGNISQKFKNKTTLRLSYNRGSFTNSKFFATVKCMCAPPRHAAFAQNC